MLIIRTAPAAFVVVSALRTLFYINSQCKEVRLFGAEKCMVACFKSQPAVSNIRVTE